MSEIPSNVEAGQGPNGAAGSQATSAESVAEEPKAPAPRTKIDFWILALALGALVGLTATVLKMTSSNQDAVAILGLLVPGVVSIGAAVFGMPIAYHAGTAKGKAEGEANKDTAAKAEAAKVAEKVQKVMDTAREKHAVTTQTLRRLMESPAGQEGYLMRPGFQYQGDVIELQVEEIEGSERVLAELSMYLQGVSDRASS